MSYLSYKPQMLTRDEFRTKVFERDNYKCVVCGMSGDAETLDAHHIMERRLFTGEQFGGYYLENGATLCDRNGEGCHMKAETTEITPDQLRDACGIKHRVIPNELYLDADYDKWGNMYLDNGMRTIGPLFYDESVQKVLKSVLPEFMPYVKYRRTSHLPWSLGVTSDDIVTSDLTNFYEKRVVVTRKMDGENLNMYSDGYIHARSILSSVDETRSWAKAFWVHRSYDLPQGWRVCAENMAAEHSLRYEGLPGYVLGFAIYDERNTCLSWDETQEYFDLLDIPSVEVLYDGVFDENAIRALYDVDRDYDTHEGYVLRLADEFNYSEFNKSVAKFVRPNHVQTSQHWRHKEMTPNGLASGIKLTR